MSPTSAPEFAVHAVTVVCTDARRSAAWYERVLGAGLEDHDSALPPTQLRIGSVRIALLANAEGPAPSEWPMQPMMALWLEVDDLVAAYRFVCDAGARVLSPLDEAAPLCFEIADPDGNVIEVWGREHIER